MRLILEDVVRERGIKFSGGEVGISVLPLDYSHAEILARIRSSDDLMSLLMLTDAIRGFNANAHISVVMPYLPYARQDRRMMVGDSLSARVFADVINSQRYAFVSVLDPHSDVGPAVLDRCHVLSAWPYVHKTVRCKEVDMLVAPDAGAAKRVAAIATQLNLPMTQACKKRDVLDKGKIVSTTLESPADVEGKRCLIVDDICDGGRTFVELSAVLRKAGTASVLLYVTHGIFSRGVECLLEGDGRLDFICTTESFRSDYDYYGTGKFHAFSLEGW